MARTVNGVSNGIDKGENNDSKTENKKQKAAPHHIMEKTEKDYKEKFNNSDYDLITGLKPQIGGNNLQNPNPTPTNITIKLSKKPEKSTLEQRQEVIASKKKRSENKANFILGLTPIAKSIYMGSSSNKPKTNIDRSPIKKYIEPAPKSKK